jgi:lipopolysaccharide heptosyltransferase II
MSGPQPNLAVEKILVRSVNWLGDAVISTCALQRLRQARPAARVTLLSPAKLAGLWEGQPFIDELATFSPSENIFQVARSLRGKNFSLGIAFPNSIRSAMELWLARVPRRIGRARPLRGLFLTDPVGPRAGSLPMRKLSAGEIRRRVARGAPWTPYPTAAHHVHDYLNLVAVLGASREMLPPRISVSQRQISQFQDRLDAEYPANQRPWFGLNPGAEYGPAKRWPAEGFAAAAAALVQQTRCRWLVFGAGADWTLAESIAGEIRGAAGDPQSAVNLAGKTSLGELAAALRLCRLLLTNDTGPMHLASAVGTPVVVLFGSTSPEMTGPLPSAHAQILRAGAPCSPCFRRQCPIDLRCLTGIEPSSVIEAAMRVLRPE